MQDPATVFLKEFLPDARAVALNELQTLHNLQGHLPLRKWHAATAAVTTHPPFVPLLGVIVLRFFDYACTSHQSLLGISSSEK